MLLGIAFGIHERRLDMLNVLQADTDILDYTEDDSDISKSKTNELNTIKDVAGGLIGKTFYNMHRFDFRGRLYSATKFLNTQNNKMAKALYTFGKKKAIGREGFQNLVKQLGDYYGGPVDIGPDANGKPIMLDSSKTMTDKDRFRVGMKLVQKYADVAADPTHPDSIEFLKTASDLGDVVSLSTEMLQLVEHVNSGKSIESYESNFILWNDATVSGAQNLAMLTGDPVTLSLVNGLETYLKRDLYTKVGKRVFGNINTKFKGLENKTWTEKDTKDFEAINKQLQDILDEKDSFAVYKDEDLAALDELYQEIVSQPRYQELATKYWSDPAKQDFVRKLAKGPVMTGFYSAGPWVMAEDMVTDFGNKPEFADLNQGLALFLTTQMKEATGAIAPGPKLAQQTFNTIAGKASSAGNLIQLDGLVNDFPFLQEYLYYTDLKNEDTGETPKAEVKIPNPDGTSQRFDGDEFAAIARIGLSFIASTQTRISSAPNITHFLDGQIVASQYTNAAVKSRDVATIHDNFGTHPSDANAQVQSVKDEMSKMYDGAPMEHIIRQALRDTPDIAEQEVKFYRDARKKMTDEQGNIVNQADKTAIGKNNYAISSAGGVDTYQQLAY